MNKGGFSTKFRPERLKELIAEGRTAKEIMKELGISRYTLKEHLMLLQRQDKQVYTIHGLVEDEAQERRTIKFRRGVIFSADALEKREFKPGDAFEMEEQDNRIILRKLT